jgi:hypothetical protein
MAVGARPPVCAQIAQAPIHEHAEAARDRITRLRAAVEWPTWFDADLWILGWSSGSAKRHREHRGQQKTPHSELKSRFHAVLSSDTFQVVLIR